MAHETCPCGYKRNYSECCGRFHRGDAYPDTAEALMRSRYSAFVKSESEYLWQTHHPKTRSPRLKNELAQPNPELHWQSLEIITTSQGAVSDKQGKVEFKAHFRHAGSHDTLHERSRFRRYKGLWHYWDGEFLA